MFRIHKSEFSKSSYFLPFVAFILMIVIVSLTFAAADGPAARRQDHAFLDCLKIGDRVLLRDNGTHYTITLPAMELGKDAYTVEKKGNDWVQVGNQVDSIRIPVSSLKAVIKQAR